MEHPNLHSSIPERKNNTKSKPHPSNLGFTYQLSGAIKISNPTPRWIYAANRTHAHSGSGSGEGRWRGRVDMDLGLGSVSTPARMGRMPKEVQ